ncbi:3-phosphoshikimate 1-carboxyvinyltransferase [Filimonas lacunae]|uniref:3-phosphoshikimate 1-carboxyvinyltransferase n=1 Tax=Filimonas lacunae TaxID=477680 RepID=A0A173MLV4_9BACT|nr:3-phosphoshikimate 1-carboxyvinyltransferase [Filimonas lacunae]BAV08467.1 5-Enolpyruvylshikimate-3-phosphate synthase [Filimonas lacunae]SIT33987.1 3-phosphoshikimate 1-carboxyvinyltransferase [Filimonas lacunae]
MDIVTIQPSTVTGAITAPASKSSMQRACAAALVRKGESIIENPGHSNDDKAALTVIQALGATIVSADEEELVVNSKGVHAVNSVVNCGESGLGIRMFAPLVALNPNPIRIEGQGSLVNRPMDFFDDTLPRLGVDIQSNDGRLPLVIKGPLQPRNIEIDGSLSSQFLTGLLMAYSAAKASNVTIVVHDLKSRPYIDLTLKVMEDFGLVVPENHNYEAFYFPPLEEEEEDESPLYYTVESDWSGGAFLLVAGAIAAEGRIVVKGLDPYSTQADKAILQALMDTGCLLSVQQDSIEIGPSLKADLQPFHFNATDCPDLFPPLVALAAYCNGTSAIEGVSRLTHKESNRALTLQDEFGKMGVEVVLQGDLMLVKGGEGVDGATVHSRHDHRIAMACAVAALQAEGETVIEEAGAISKSYPDFYEHLQKLGAAVKIEG